jgi:flavin reductase (DIM6/NTAB) family NADH-FMN oxidoreductase RutF
MECRASSRDALIESAASQSSQRRTMTEFDAAKISWQDQYKLMVGTVTPRPIALVTTLGRNGPNAAPFSFFNAVGSDPAMLMFSVGDKSGAAKAALSITRRKSTRSRRPG